MTAFATLVVDWPWQFDQGTSSADRKFHGTVGDHYQTMPASEAARFPLPPMLPDCHMFFWRVASMQQEALDIIRTWQFNGPKSELVWLKKTKFGKRHFGMGRHVRMEHEICLITTRGRGSRTDDKSIRSTFTTEFECDLDENGGGTFSAVVPERKHSKKPPEFYAIVERLCRGPYVELFSREERPGWTCYGNEVGASAPDVFLDDAFPI